MSKADDWGDAVKSLMTDEAEGDSADDMERTAHDKPKFHQKLKATMAHFGQVVAVSCNTSTGETSAQEFSEGITLKRDGKRWVFWLLNTISSHSGALYTEEKCTFKNVREVDRAERAYLWIEYSCSTRNEEYVENSAKPKQTIRKMLSGFVFTLERDGAPRAIAGPIPVVDDRVIHDGKPAQIDVDFDSAEHMSISPRTQHLSAEQKKWVGMFDISHK